MATWATYQYHLLPGAIIFKKPFCAARTAARLLLIIIIKSFEDNAIAGS